MLGRESHQAPHPPQSPNSNNGASDLRRVKSAPVGRERADTDDMLRDFRKVSDDAVYEGCYSDMHCTVQQMWGLAQSGSEFVTETMDSGITM